MRSLPVGKVKPTALSLSDDGKVTKLANLDFECLYPTGGSGAQGLVSRKGVHTSR